MAEVSPELAETLRLHALWLSTDGDDDEQADLTERDLSGVCFSRRDPRNIIADRANFQRANFEHADLSRAQLEGADFSNANLQFCALDRAHIQCANFTGAKLKRASLHLCDAKHAKFEDADLRLSDLTASRLDVQAY